MKEKRGAESKKRKELLCMRGGGLGPYEFYDL